MDCIFCKINKGEIPSYTIYEDDIVKVFLDIHPKHNGHTLIIPKKHYKDIEDIDMDVLSHIMETAKKIYQLLNQKLNPDGIVLTQNNGIAQDVKHYHLHLVPVYKNEMELSIEEIYNKLKN